MLITGTNGDYRAIVWINDWTHAEMGWSVGLIYVEYGSFLFQWIPQEASNKAIGSDQIKKQFFPKSIPKQWNSVTQCCGLKTLYNSLLSLLKSTKKTKSCKNDYYHVAISSEKTPHYPSVVTPFGLYFGVVVTAFCSSLVTWFICATRRPWVICLFNSSAAWKTGKYFLSPNLPFFLKG